MKKEVGLSLFGAVVALCGANAAEPVLSLVVDGRPNAVIVVPAKASRAATEGAKILAEHLFEISGAHVKILKEDDLGPATVTDGRIKPVSTTAGAETFILIGEGELAQKLGQSSKGLGPGGILIRTVGNALVLLGPDDQTPPDPFGSRYAVTTFLEDALGCRYLWPGRLLDEKWRMMRRIFKEEHFAVNVAAMCWGEWGRFKRLGWDGPSQQATNAFGFDEEQPPAEQEAALTALERKG